MAGCGSKSCSFPDTEDTGTQRQCIGQPRAFHGQHKYRIVVERVAGISCALPSPACGTCERLWIHAEGRS